MGRDDEDVTQAAIYADIGMVDEEGNEVEVIELSNGRSCADTLSALRKRLEDRDFPEY